MLFAGFKIEGIDANRVPTDYDSTDATLPLTIYVKLEWNKRDGDEGPNVELNATLMNLWIDDFNQEVGAWLQEDDDIVLPDGSQLKIEYDRTEGNCLRVEGATLEDIEGIAEPLQGFIDHINEYIENELDRRQEFREHAEAINSEYFGEEEGGGDKW